MRFSDSKYQSAEAGVVAGEVASHGIRLNRANGDRRGKFALLNFGLSFLAVSSLGLWIFETGQFGSTEAMAACLAFLPLSLAIYIRKQGEMIRAQAMLLATIALAILLAGLSFNDFAQPALLVLALLPVLALTHDSKISVLTGAGLSALSIATIFITHKIAAPYQIAGISGLLVLVTTFSLHAKVKLEKYRAQLIAERARFDTLIEMQKEMITSHTPNGQTLYVSDNAFEFIGSPSQALLNSGLAEKVHLQDRIVMLKAISDAASRNAVQSCEMRIRCKSDDTQVWKWVAMRCVPNRDAASGTVSVNAVTSDIGELKEMAQRASSAEAMLVAAQERNEATFTVLENDLQKPLKALTDEADLGARETGFSNQFAHSVLTLSHNILRRIDQLIVEAGPDRLSQGLSDQTFVVGAVIDQAISRCQAASTEIQIQKKLANSLPEMTGDEHVVETIMSALLWAASQSTEPTKVVAVRAQQHGPRIRFFIRYEDAAGDDQQANADVGVAKRLIASMGGHFETRRSGGSKTFTFTLPIKSRRSSHAVCAENFTSSHSEKPDLQTEGESRARLSA